jgi:hypothetical protein
MLKETDVEATLENCRALINQINAGLSAEEAFVDASSARELLFYLERATSAFKRSVSRSRERDGTRSPSIITDGALRLRTLHHVSRFSTDCRLCCPRTLAASSREA